MKYPTNERAARNLMTEQVSMSEVHARRVKTMRVQAPKRGARKMSRDDWETVAGQLLLIFNLGVWIYVGSEILQGVSL